MDDKRSNGKNYSDDVAMVIKVEKDSYEENTYYAAECCTPDGILWGISTDLQVLSYEKDHYIIDYPPLYVPDGYINILHAATLFQKPTLYACNVCSILNHNLENASNTISQLLTIL